MTLRRKINLPLFELEKAMIVMSKKISYPISASQAGRPRAIHAAKAVAAASGTSLREKMIIAAAVVAFALAYAKGVTLMIDPADTPNGYTAFIYRAD